MPREEYGRKRRRDRTPEPFGGGSTGEGPIFVVQRHAARRLHYDLRLERDGTLASWAVPRGVPLYPGRRHLAVQVEDHPLDYARFEGRIPEGEYGAGSVEIWDEGTYELVEEKRDGGLTVRLHGQRLDGTWTLVPAHLDGNAANWLLVRKDGHAEPARQYRPMLATPSATLPTGPGWLFEPKWDGYRALATVSSGECALSSRNGTDLTPRFASLARAVTLAIRSPDAVLDGEVCSFDAAGRPSFGALQRGDPGNVLVVFDVLEIDGRPVADLPLVERRARLEALVDGSGEEIALSPVFGDGEALLRAAKEQGLEGVMAKRGTSQYRSGRRSPDWRKLSLGRTTECVVAGYTRGRGSRAGTLGALVLGVLERGRLRWVGNVGTGFTADTADELVRLLEPLRCTPSPFVPPPRMPRVPARDVNWVEPVLVAEVSFKEWTASGRLRAPVFTGLRDDKRAEEARRERSPLDPVVHSGRRKLELSNLDKLFWPEEGITKGDVLAYYRAVAPVLVPHLKGRPFTMKRYPDGWQGKHFFQKNVPSHAPSWLRSASLPATTRDGEARTISYALVDDLLALLWVVNMGCIDLHTWTARADLPRRPDWVVLDLDPADGVGFDVVIEVALLVQEVLELMGLESFPKTSGSKGMHVLVPISRRHTHEDARRFASIVSGTLARTHPGLVTTAWTRSKRRGVLIDANQNGAGRTTASVYSVRPRAGATVSTPLTWDEVRKGLDPAAFTMDAVLDRVARDGDLAGGVLTVRQSLGAALRAAASR